MHIRNMVTLSHNSEKYNLKGQVGWEVLMYHISRRIIRKMSTKLSSEWEKKHTSPLLKSSKAISRSHLLQSQHNGRVASFWPNLIPQGTITTQLWWCCLDSSIKHAKEGVHKTPSQECFIIDRTIRKHCHMEKCLLLFFPPFCKKD